jgi:hypothetical protein
MFPNNLPKMQNNGSINWVTHHELDWEYVTTMLRKKKEILVDHILTLHAKWGTMLYLLFPIWTRRWMDLWHLPTHVPFAMPNHFDDDKDTNKKMVILQLVLATNF